MDNKILIGTLVERARDRMVTYTLQGDRRIATNIRRSAG
jgi:hypothetical protein